MNKYVDLEISLHRHDASSYAVDVHITQPDSDTDIRLGQTKPVQALFDHQELTALSVDPQAYGQRLTSGLFADPAVQNAFGQARAASQAAGLPLRMRLSIGPTASDLHSLYWEMLRDPADGAPLATNENLLFSRYLSSTDWRPVRLRAKGELRALALIANPANLADYGLDPVDVPGELERARLGLGDIPLTALPDEANGSRAALNELITRLRDESHPGGFDILYIVCHGMLVDGEPWLWLEDEAGKVERTSGTDLVTRLKELQQHPRLIVLASCQSAGAGTGQALAALGPRLAEAGIPSVIAMQGNVSMSTIAEFMPIFFKELQRDGQIDRALAVARGEVRQRPDYWMPVLYMRLKSGRIWYVPGFGDDRKSFEKWPILVRSIERGRCTPILGSGLFEPMLGSMYEIARRLAEAYNYPMASHERESLPQVAQYLAVNQGKDFPYYELEDYLRREVQRRFSADLSPEMRQGRVSLDRLIDVVGSKLRERNPLDPYKILAQLPLPIYITTNLNNQLATSLREAGKDPQVAICPWNKNIELTETIFDREPDYYPSPERPLVYHLFGRFDNPYSVVLTEDDYFDFLIGVTSNKSLIPPVVRSALTNSSLLFLGFQMNDWNFRVLFRTILGDEGGALRDRQTHIAVQIEPEEGRIQQPERARRYLEDYFKGASMHLFWGSAEDFLIELHRQFVQMASPELMV